MRVFFSTSPAETKSPLKRTLFSSPLPLLSSSLKMKSSTFILVALAAAAGTSVNSLPQPAFSNKNPSQRPATAALPTTHTYPPRPESSPNARTLGIMNPLHSSVFRPLRCSSAVSDIEKSIFDLEIHLLETRRDEPNDIKSIQNLEYLLLQQRHRLAGERARGGETAASPIPSPPSLVRSPNEVSRLGSTTSSNSDPFNFDYLLTGGASASDRMSLKGLDRRFEDMALKKNMPQADDASSDKAVVLIPKKHDIFVERNR